MMNSYMANDWSRVSSGTHQDLAQMTMTFLSAIRGRGIGMTDEPGRQLYASYRTWYLLKRSERPTKWCNYETLTQHIVDRTMLCWYDESDVESMLNENALWYMQELLKVITMEALFLLSIIVSKVAEDVYQRATLQLSKTHRKVVEMVCSHLDFCVSIVGSRVSYTDILVTRAIINRHSLASILQSIIRKYNLLEDILNEEADTTMNTT